MTFATGGVPHSGPQQYSLPAELQEKPKNTGVGSLSLLQQIFPTQESNQGLLHRRRILYQLSYQGGMNCRVQAISTIVLLSFSFPNMRNCG